MTDRDLDRPKAPMRGIRRLVIHNACSWTNSRWGIGPRLPAATRDASSVRTERVGRVIDRSVHFTRRPERNRPVSASNQSDRSEEHDQRLAKTIQTGLRVSGEADANSVRIAGLRTILRVRARRTLRQMTRLTG